MKRLKGKLAAMAVAIMLMATGMVTVNTASALETPGACYISHFYVSDDGGFHFRVYTSSPIQWFCSNGPSNPAWAYIEKSDSGAETKIQTLMLAYALGKRVVLHTQGVSTYAGHMCHIVEVILMP